jgi:hypothetical protein
MIHLRLVSTGSVRFILNFSRACDICHVACRVDNHDGDPATNKIAGAEGRKSVKIITCARLALLGVAALTAALACGCASMNPAPSPGTPYVQNCGVLNTGTPSRFVCNGKVYTSFQLAKIREDQAKKYSPGQ